MVQLELTRRTVEGTLSAIFGPSELAQDEDVRTFFYTPAELRAQYRTLPSATRGVLGHVLGLSGPYRPAAWSPLDTLAVGNYLAREFGGGGGSELQNLSFLNYLDSELAKPSDPTAASDAIAVFNDARWINDPTAPTTVPSGPRPPATAAANAAASAAAPAPSEGTTATALAALDRAGEPAIKQATSTLAADRESVLKTGISLDVLAHGGSDAFVVAPWRSADHHTLLWGGPQEGISNPSVDWEVYLHGPGGYDAGA